MQHNTKLLFLDIDGTLLPNGAMTTNPEMISAVKQVAKQLQVTLCTGRALSEAAKIIELFGLEASYHILESGALLLSPGLEVLEKFVLTSQDAEKILTAAGATIDGLGLCCESEWVDEVSKLKIPEFSTLALHAKTRDKTKIILEATKDIQVHYHFAVGTHPWIEGGEVILITPKGAGKGEGVKRVQKELAVSKAQSAGAGDMPNDLPMLEQVGIKFAMGNADESVKQVADYLLPSVEENGLLEAFEILGLRISD